jgi:uncharacterized protein YicC (UPF0701 family)
MEFSLFEILGIFQKVDLISRFLARTDLVDFLTFAIIIGIIYSKLGVGAKKIVGSIDEKLDKFTNQSKNEFREFKEDIGDKIKALQTGYDNNTTRIENLGNTLGNNIKAVETEIKTQIREDKREVKGEIVVINQRIDHLQEFMYSNIKTKKK